MIVLFIITIIRVNLQVYLQTYWFIMFNIRANSSHQDFYLYRLLLKIVSEYDQEIPQSQTADNPMAPRGRAAQPSQDSRKTN